MLIHICLTWGCLRFVLGTAKRQHAEKLNLGFGPSLDRPDEANKHRVKTGAKNLIDIFWVDV